MSPMKRDVVMSLKVQLLKKHWDRGICVTVLESECCPLALASSDALLREHVGGKVTVSTSAARLVLEDGRNLTADLGLLGHALVRKFDDGRFPEPRLWVRPTFPGVTDIGLEFALSDDSVR